MTSNYTEETIYGKMSEMLIDHQFEVSLGLRQPWGTATGGFEAAQILNRQGRYRISAFGGMDVRLFKGFSVGFNGSVSRRRDQLSLRRGEATSEEILVRQRELATDYAFDFGFGISYSFGSIFNSVVNPALPQRRWVLALGSCDSRLSTNAALAFGTTSRRDGQMRNPRRRCACVARLRRRDQRL